MQPMNPLCRYTCLVLILKIVFIFCNFFNKKNALHYILSFIWHTVVDECKYMYLALSMRKRTYNMHWTLEYPQSKILLGPALKLVLLRFVSKLPNNCTINTCIFLVCKIDYRLVQFSYTLLFDISWCLIKLVHLHWTDDTISK